MQRKWAFGSLRGDLDAVRRSSAINGKHEQEDEAIRRGMAKSGTTHFHCYATLYTVKSNKRYTLALTLVRRSEKVLDVLQRLLNRVKSLKMHIKRLLLDRGFDYNAIIGYLRKQPLPTIIALTMRGKTGGTRALLKGRKSYVTTYTRRSTIYPTQTFAVHVACKYAKGPTSGKVSVALPTSSSDN